MAVACGDLATADVGLAHDLAIVREFGLPWDQAIALNGTRDLRRARAEYDAGWDAYAEAVDVIRTLSPLGRVPPGVLHNLGYMATLIGEPRE